MRSSSAPRRTNPAPHGAIATPGRAEPAPDGADSAGWIGRSSRPMEMSGDGQLRATHRQLELALAFDLSTEAGCVGYARELARRTVMALQRELLTKEAALDALSRRYRLGSFARKLWKGENAVIRADRLFRLERAWADARRSLAELL